MNDLTPVNLMDIEVLNDQLDSIFHELDLALLWKRPSILFAIYNSSGLRRSAQDALEKQILESGQGVVHYQFEYESSVSLAQFVSDITCTKNAVFYIDPLNSDGKVSQIKNLISLLNSCRDYLVDHLVRVVFWLTENEALNVAHQAPDFWASRHRVFEFIDRSELALQKPVPQSCAVSTAPQLQNMDLSISAPNAEGLPGESELALALPETDDPSINDINLLLAQGVENWKAGNHQKAFTPLRAALAIAEKSGNQAHMILCYKAIALVKSDAGNDTEAIQAYQRVIQLGLETAAIWNNIGSLYQKIGKLEDALAAFNNALNLDPSDPVSWNGRGGVYAITERFEEAIVCYRKAIQFNASYLTPWVKLGDVLLRQNRYEDALYAYMRTVEMDKKNVHAWSEIGSIYFKAGSYDQAVDAYKKAVRLGVDSAGLYANLADSFTNTGAYTEAIANYQKAIERETDNTAKASLWNRLGDARRRLNDYESAVGAYEMADKLVSALGAGSSPQAEISEFNSTQSASLAAPQLQASQAQPTGMETASMAVEEDGNLLPAIQSSSSDLTPIVSLPGISAEEKPGLEGFQPDPKGAELWTRLGNTYLKAGAIERAIDVFHKALTLDPSNTPEYGHLAQVYIQKNDLLGAVSIYQKSLELLDSKKEKALTLSNIGDLYRRMREFVNALDAFETAIELDPENEIILTGLSKIQEDLDQVNNPGNQAQEQSGKTPELISPAAQSPIVEKPDPKISAADDNTAELGNINLNNANVWNELGNIFTRAKVYAEAVDAYNKAIELNPYFGWSYSNLALVHSRQGKREAAISLYLKSIELLWTDLDKATAWNRLGDVFRQLGNYSDAINAYQNADSLSQGTYEINPFHEINPEQLFTHFVS